MSHVENIFTYIEQLITDGKESHSKNLLNIIFSKSNIIYATNDNDDNNDNHGGFGRMVEKSFTSSHSSIIGNKFGLDTWCLCKLIW